MSEVTTLKECLKEVNCHLKVLLKKYEMLRKERDKDFEVFSRKHEAFRSYVFASEQTNKALLEENTELEANYAKLFNSHTELRQCSAQELRAMEEELASDIGGAKELKEQNAALKKRLMLCEEELSLANIQAETYRIDFKLERECREKLNDEKLKLEEALAGVVLKRSVPPRNGEIISAQDNCRTVVDDANIRQCFICNHIEEDSAALGEHVMMCLERNEIPLT